MAAKNSVEIDGVRFRNVRESLGYGQREFAELLGLTESRVQQIERSDRVGVYRRTVRKIAELMKLQVSAATKMLTPLDLTVIGEPGERGPVRGYEDLWAQLDRLMERLAEIEGTDVEGIIEMFVKGTAPGRKVRSPKSPSKASPASLPPKPEKSQRPTRETKGETGRGGRSK